MGNTASSSLTTQCIDEVNPKTVIMFGLAGGIGENREISSILLPSKIFYYETAKELDLTTEPRPESLHVDFQLHRELCNSSIIYNKSVSDDKKLIFKNGPIACGEKVVQSESFQKKLIQQNSKLIGIEMESYGAIYAAMNSICQPKFVTIRCVSDTADQTKTDQFRQEALESGVIFLDYFLSQGTPLLRPQPYNPTNQYLAINHISQENRPLSKDDLQECLPSSSEKEYKLVNINCSQYYNNGSLTSLSNVLNIQNQNILKIKEILSQENNISLAYFSFAHIPLIFHLGYEIGTIPVDFFIAPRPSRKWKKLLDDENNWSGLSITGFDSKMESTITEAILVMSLSVPIKPCQIEAAIDQIDKPVISISHSNPHLDNLVSKIQLDSYTKQFLLAKDEIKRIYPNIKTIHLFYGGPPALAFQCAQQISKTFDPQFIVYNFSGADNPNYGWAINISTNEIIDNRQIGRDDNHA